MPQNHHPCKPKQHIEGSPFQFEFMGLDELNNEFYRTYLDEDARKKLIRAALERKISSLTIKNARDSEQGA